MHLEFTDMFVLCRLVFVVVCAAVGAPTMGQYKPATKFYSIPNIGGDGGLMHVYYPSNVSQGETFPLISYAHGLDGGSIDLLGYAYLFNRIASFGFIVVAPNTCGFLGCADREKRPWTDCNKEVVHSHNPLFPLWDTWFGEQLRAIEFAQNQSKTSDPIFAMMDSAAGVGIAGHSMGGQATSWAAHENCTSHWNIKAAAVHHGVTATNNTKIGVPLAAFGGTLDSWISQMTKDMFVKSPVYPKMWRYITGASSTHLEPVLLPPLENPLLATYTAAWFKVFLGQDPDNYWSSMLFNKSNANYLCNSQKMKECIVEQKAPLVVV